MQSKDLLKYTDITIIAIEITQGCVAYLKSVQSVPKIQCCGSAADWTEQCLQIDETRYAFPSPCGFL